MNNDLVLKTSNIIYDLIDPIIEKHEHFYSNKNDLWHLITLAFEEDFINYYKNMPCIYKNEICHIYEILVLEYDGIYVKLMLSFGEKTRYLNIDDVRFTGTIYE